MVLLASVMVVVAIVLAVCLTRPDTTKVTDIGSSTTSPLSTSATQMTYPPPGPGRLPSGITNWTIIQEVYVNTPALNTRGQLITTTTGSGTNGEWLWIESKGTQFSIALNMTMVSPYFAYYSTDAVAAEPLFIFLTPDLPRSNSQCVLRINTYASGTLVNEAIIPPNPLSSVVFVLFVSV